MAAKINWHRYGTKLRHCHPVYFVAVVHDADYNCLTHARRRSRQQDAVDRHHSSDRADGAVCRARLHLRVPLPHANQPTVPPSAARAAQTPRTVLGSRRIQHGRRRDERFVDVEPVNAHIPVSEMIIVSLLSHM